MSNFKRKKLTTPDNAVQQIPSNLKRKKFTTLDKKAKRTPFAIFAVCLVGLYCLSLVAALLWAGFSSTKHLLDFEESPFGWYEHGITFKNYVDAFTRLYVPISTENGTRYVYLLEMFGYSVVWAVGTAFVMTASRCICAYVCAKFSKFKITKLMYALVIILMSVSFPSNLAISIQFNKMVGLYDNLIGRIVMSFTFTGTHFLFFYAAFKGVSREYAEAAYVDGAGLFTTMFKIMIPMVANMFLALFILEFIAQWNDYTISLVYLPSTPVVAYGLFRIQQNPIVAGNIPEMLASCTMVIIPTLALFIVFKDKLVSSMSIGGLKG